MITLIINCNSKKETSVNELPEIISSVVITDLDLSKNINLTDLENIGSDDLRLLRNEIFARKGYRFRSVELGNYFKKFNWYNPRFEKEEITNYLTEIDNLNIELISKQEEFLKTIKEMTSFEDYLQLIPQIDLPLSFICEKGFPIAKINYDYPIIRKFKPEGGTIIGKLYVDTDEVGIIYGYPADIFYPILTKWDLEGNKIGELRFFELGHCVSDAGYEATTKGTISNDLLLSTQTEIIEWDYENEQPKKDTTRIENEIWIN